MTNTEYFIRIAEVIGSKSKCNRLKVGAVLVDSHNRILSTGYNGGPAGSLYDEESEEKTNPWVLHAELNCLLYANQNINGCTMYITHSCCIHCASILVQAGIKKVVYDKEYRDKSGIEFLKNHNITVVKYEKS